MGSREDALREMDRLGDRGEEFIFVVDFDMASPVVLAPAEAARRGILFDFRGATNAPTGNAVAPVTGPVAFEKHPVGFGEYRKAYNTILDELHKGNSYLLNLTFPTPVETDLTLERIFALSRAKYRLLFRDQFVCFSPETFVTIGSGVISSFPMKGTIDASLPDAETVLLEDPKEEAEHTTIVDLIRNDLNMVSRDVRVEDFRYVERISTHERQLLQTSSRITGRLPEDYRSRLGSILFALLPAGSVTGAPKEKTVEIIRRAEPSPRGYFTGVAGYFDGEKLDSCVLIRFIEQAASGLVYRSGGGLTVRSRPEDEYREMLDKVYVPLV